MRYMSGGDARRCRYHDDFRQVAARYAAHTRRYAPAS